MCQIKHSKTNTPILAALLCVTIFFLAGCGQRGPLKLPDFAVPAKQIPQESPAK